ncbi:mucin-desulfating sulfatase [Cryptococcus neoformans MW-RSA36]|nr:mucin-desulfating sulfatase [Cryptococcus neoformans var. grubii MW-RSA36]
MQGKSFLPSLYGQSQQSDKDIAYHRYWMHGDEYHNAYAHYGIRSKRYKLIFWYNEGGDLPGSRQGGEDQEWELFDCEEDPLELFNLWSDDSYGTVRETMIRLLEEKMEEIGDEAQHPIGKTGKQLQQLYPSGASLGRKANQRNL